MGKKVFSFQGQLQVGKEGVSIAKALFRDRGYNIQDYENDKEVQHRGIDLWVQSLGYVEVKTDTYDTGNTVLEVSDRGLPGALDRSCADYYGIVFIKLYKMVLFPRAGLQMWLRKNYAWLRDKHPDWFHTISSRQGNSNWEVEIVVVPLSMLIEEVEGRMETIIIEWTDEDMIISGKWEEGR